jgi:endonuclease/exonuclease/phosphatase family metal-dependent hydrolase
MFSALTFNMQNGQGWDEANPDDPEVSLAGTLAFLQEQDADVIFLQEVEYGYEGGRQVEPPPHYEWLKERLAGYEGVFGYPRPNPEEIPFGLGLAIFSKTPLRNFHRMDLPPPDVTFEFGGVMRRPSYRVLIGAETEIEGRVVHLLNTHLQAFFMINKTSDEYCAQRDLVEDELRRKEGPLLLGGDFNAAPNEKLLEQFAQAGFQPCQCKDVTWRRMPYVLDHIFYNAELQLEGCRVIPTPASDHHAVRSEFSFSK